MVVVDVILELARVCLLSELLHANDLVLITETIENKK